jgi:signal transduction histidine kinase
VKFGNRSSAFSEAKPFEPQWPQIMVPAQILIVEDETVIALDIEESLIRLGYAVTTVVDSAEAALEAVAQQQPDLVLMDIHLQGHQNGIAAAAQIRQDYRVPVVFLTAHADPATLSQVKATQPFGYIVKPFNLRDLSVTIEIALSRYQAETSVQQALEQAQALNQLKSQFVSIVSHEFRNPLSAVRFSLDLLDAPPEAFSVEKRQTFIQRAKAAVERMNQLLEDVLILGETESTESRCFDCQLLPLPVLSFCQDLIEPFEIDASHAIELVAIGVSDDQPVRLDQRLLRHILSNLLSNAIKYSPAGSKIQLRLIRQASQLSFQIQDQGIGISVADQACLFDSFYRGDNVGSIPGTGLGLAIVKQCVEAHRGQIGVESQPGIGTTFTVTLDL